MGFMNNVRVQVAIIALALPPVAGAAELRISCPTTVPPVNQTFQSEVTVNVGTMTLGAYTIAVLFDENVVTIVSIDGGNTTQFASKPVSNFAEYASGRARVSAFNSSTTAPTGVVSIAKVTFTVVSHSPLPTDLNLEVIRLVDGTLNANTILTTVAACRTPNCRLDVDGNGTKDVATDAVYIARRLLGLVPVPPSFRSIDPTISSDAVIGAAIDAPGNALDVDGSGLVDVATDIVYVARRLLGLPPVPSSFRAIDPTIPSDAVIGASIDGLCPD